LLFINTLLSCLREKGSIMKAMTLPMEQELVGILRSVLESIPGSVREFHVKSAGSELGDPFDVHVSVRGITRGDTSFYLSIKEQPRPSQFPFEAYRKRLREVSPDGCPVLAAPSISERMSDLCGEHGWGWVDLAGNCRLEVPGGLYIERTGRKPVHQPPRPKANLSTSASARVLRTLLVPEHRDRRWTQTELREACEPEVSMGLVHKVVTHLREEAWLTTGEDGRFTVVDPAGLAEAWSTRYRFDRHRRVSFFSLLKPKEICSRLASAFPDSGSVAEAVFTAAERDAPHVRQNKTWLYVRDWDLVKVQDLLEATVVTSGENLVVLIPEDEGVFFQTVRDPQSGMERTNPLQTWLDLMQAGGRGKEAAEALMKQRLRPVWEKEPGDA
jgi:hypothetical protein